MILTGVIYINLPLHHLKSIWSTYIYQHWIPGPPKPSPRHQNHSPSMSTSWAMDILLYRRTSCQPSWIFLNAQGWQGCIIQILIKDMLINSNMQKQITHTLFQCSALKWPLTTGLLDIQHVFVTLIISMLTDCTMVTGIESWYMVATFVSTLQIYLVKVLKISLFLWSLKPGNYKIQMLCYY